MREFLHPIRGGSSGAGWPFGRDVHAGELMRILAGVSDVRHVTGLCLAAGDGDWTEGAVSVPAKSACGVDGTRLRRAGGRMTPLHPSYGPTFRSNDRLTGANLTSWQQVPLFAAAQSIPGLHRLYGVADGLIVTLDNDQITVSEGVAYDGYGRPLCLLEKLKEGFKELSAKGNPDGKTESCVLILQGEKPVQPQLDVPVPAPQPCKVVSKVVSVDPRYSIKPWEVPLAMLKWDVKNGARTR